MILRGVKARVISLQPPQLGDYPLLTAPIVVAPEEIFSLDWSDQHIVATYWFTSYMVKSLTLRYPEVSGYYYVQDYEPWFYPRPERFKTVQQVEKSYEQGLTCVAKTEYLKDLLKSRHGVDVSLVTPGLYRGAFYPGLQNEYQGPPRLAALFRQRTPRRGGEELLSVLKIVKEQLPELQVTLFGDTEGLPEELAAQVNLVGVLSQNKVGALYRDTDIVVDLSHWHGFGRMGIEGMACGAVPVLTRSGGVERYASDNENSFLLEVGDIAGTAKAIVRLATDKLLRIKMRQAGLESLIGISEMQATSDWLTVFGMSESQKNVADKGSTGAVQSAAK
jgi:glycosyltransferase involved in cell wall biosynthesis